MTPKEKAEKLVDKYHSYIDIKSKLCYYDFRNPNGISLMADNPELYGYDKVEFSNYGNFSQENCGCDNCFYGRTKLAEEIIKILEYYDY